MSLLSEIFKYLRNTYAFTFLCQVVYLEISSLPLEDLFLEEDLPKQYMQLSDHCPLPVLF